MRTMSPRCNAGLQHTQVPPFSAPTSHRKKHKGKSALSSAFKLRSARKSRCSNSQSNATIDDAFVALVSLVLHRRGLNQETT